MEDGVEPDGHPPVQRGVFTTALAVLATAAPIAFFARALKVYLVAGHRSDREWLSAAPDKTAATA